MPDRPSIPFIWPETVFVRGNTLAEQFAHVISEVDEVAQAAPIGFPEDSQGLAMPAELLALCREMGDLHHSLETWWRKIALLYGWAAVREIFAWIEAKNAARGYYLENSAPNFLLPYLARTEA